jgi:glycosyltransferase involved in cell wall biosynthesis
MKILLCHNFYQQSGGEDVAVLALKTLLEAKGHRVIFYAEDNRKIEKYGALQKIGFFPRTIFSVRTYRRLRRIAAQEKPDIAHVHNVFPLVSPALYVALKRAGLPVVQTIHNYRLMCINGLFLRDGLICERCKSGQFFSGFRFKCYRNSYTLSGLYALAIGGHRRWGTFNLIDHFIALSQFSAIKIADSGVAEVSKISILENFLPTPLPEYDEADLANPYLVYLGRLAHEKGIFTLLEALCGLTSLRLKVMGVGPLQDAIENYIDDHRLENVEMLGFIDGEEKYRILRRALCCVVPSECYENFPYAVLESAAVGTPVVASRIGGLAAIISDGETGCLFTPGNSAELRGKLELLAGSPELVTRMGRQARQQVETRHTPDAHYEKLMNIYGAVMRPLRMVALSQSRDGVPSSCG